MAGIDLTWRRLQHTAFIGGLGLSVAAALVLMLAAYFAGTAPHLPGTAQALETLKTGGNWLAPVTTKTLDARAAPTTAQAANVSLLPRSPDASQAPPIEISDLPPPEHHIR